MFCQLHLHNWLRPVCLTHLSISDNQDSRTRLASSTLYGIWMTREGNATINLSYHHTSGDGYLNTNIAELCRQLVVFFLFSSISSFSSLISSDSFCHLIFDFLLSLTHTLSVSVRNDTPYLLVHYNIYVSTLPAAGIRGSTFASLPFPPLSYPFPFPFSTLAYYMTVCMQYSKVQYSTVHYCMHVVQYSTVQYSTVRCSTVCTSQYPFHAVMNGRRDGKHL